MSFGEKTCVFQTPAHPIPTAVVGDFRRADFQIAIRQIRFLTPAVYFDQISLILNSTEFSHSYDLIFLLASSPGEFPVRNIEMLQNRWPLTRIVMIAGSLTEGERRTGNLPPELLRYYWHQWQTEVMPAFTAFCERRPSPWGLPLNVSDEERLLNSVAIAEQNTETILKSANITSNPRKKMPETQQVFIVSDDLTMREMLFDRAKQKGMIATAIHLPEIESCETGTCGQASEIWFDVVSENFAETLAAVRLLRTHWHKPSRLIVFYNAPRPHEAEQLTHAGASRIISKPFLTAW